MNVNKYLPKSAIFALLISLFVGISLLLSANFAGFADAVNSSVCRLFRGAISRISALLPFSLTELLLILSPIILVLVFRLALRSTASRTSRIRFAVSAAAILSLFFSAYALTLGFSYRASPIAEKMSLTLSDGHSQSELEAALSVLAKRVGREAEEVGDFDYQNATSAIMDSYLDFYEEYPIIDSYTPPPKRLLFSELPSRLGVLGLYFPYTAEVNINTRQPSYMISFSIAHELAHAKGIAKEDEANFLAFVICSTSSDPFVRYSGYLSAFEIVASALYRCDADAYFSILKSLPERAIFDLRSSSDFLSLSNNSFADAVGTANDAHLKASGTAGAVSYNLALELIVSYCGYLSSS